MPAARERTTARAAPEAAARRATREAAAPRPGPAALLQRQMGNRAFRRAAHGGAPRVQRACACGGTCAHCSGEDETVPVQTKLTVGAPGDAYEQEADRVAARVTGGSEAAPPAVRRLSAGAPAAGHSDVSLPMGEGRPLSPATRDFMEPRIGADFSGVRLHAGPQAEAASDRLQARAFTYGSDVWLGRGASEGDRRLMAHELTHVVQQTGGGANRVARQTIDGSCTGREAVLRAAWAEGVRLTNETIGTLEAVLQMASMGGALARAPRIAGVIQNAFGEVSGLEGVEPGQVGITNIPRIIERYRRIAAGFSGGKKLRCDPETVGEGNECDWRAAFVVTGNRDDIFLCPTFFEGTGAGRDTERGATLLHEMAHVQLGAAHAGLPEREFPGMAFDCSAPLGLTFDDALRNAFAYDLLANCLHGTRPSSEVMARPEVTRTAPGDPRFSLTGSVGGRVLDDSRHFASLLGARLSLRTGELVVFNPVIGLNAVYVPGSGAAPAHLAAAVLDVGLRVQQPLRGVYVDVLGSGFVGFEAQSGAPTRFTSGVGGALGVGFRWERIEVGAEARGLVPLENLPTVDRGSLLILGRGAVRF